MQRILVGTSLAVAAATAVTSLATGQPTPIRAAVKTIASSTTPARDRTRPYTFTTRGRITPPPACAPGVFPKLAGGSCVPAVCPPGASNVAYCIQPPLRVLCTGTVTIRFKKVGGTFTISSRSVGLRRDCTFSSAVTFHTTLPTRRGKLKVSTRFEGNPFLLPKNAAPHFVRAG